MTYGAVILCEDVIESFEMRQALDAEYKDGVVYAFTLDDAFCFINAGIEDGYVPSLILAPDLTAPDVAKAVVRGEQKSIRIRALVVSPDILGCWELEDITDEC